MKKIIASITMLAAGAALASTVTSAQTFGVLKVTSSLKDTVVSVPWVAAGTSTDEPVKVKDFVKTTGLKKDDVLLKYDNSTGTYNGWLLDADDGSWGGAIVVVKTGTSSTVSENATLARGDALIIRRNGTPRGDGIYLYGQYAAAPSSYSIPRGVGLKTLFAPVNTSSSEIYLNDLTWNGAQDGDTIKLQGDIPLTFTYKSTETEKWGIKLGGQWITDGAVIRPGEGVWYTAISAGDSVTVSGF